jgi:hypothetical protein
MKSSIGRAEAGNCRMNLKADDDDSNFILIKTILMWMYILTYKQKKEDSEEHIRMHMDLPI